MKLKDGWKIIKQSGSDFISLNILKLSGALAFFTIFALPGLLIIIIWFSDLFYGRDIVEGSLYHQIEIFVGESAAISIQETIRNATTTTGGSFATIIGFVALIIGATSIFSEIQDSINHIWRLKIKPKKGLGLLKLIFDRLLSFSMIITLGFILLVSLVINGGMDLLMNSLMEQYPDVTVMLVYVLNQIVTYFITAFIFAAIFKVLPDAQIRWRHVWVGAFVTAGLFMAGRFLISFYLGNNRMSSAYGAAGSIIVVLMWVYYSSMILYFGAAFTHAYAKFRGTKIYPNSYAVLVKQIEVESEKSIQENDDEIMVIEIPDDPDKQ